MRYYLSRDMESAVNTMNQFKAGVYERARVSLENDIQREKRSVAYWRHVEENYPHSPNGTDVSHHDFSQACVYDFVERDTALVKQTENQRPFVKKTMDREISLIFKQMSHRPMTDKRIRKIGGMMDNFMKLSGLPWIHDFYYNHWNKFLLDSWDDSMVPIDKESVWIKIPWICHTFMHKLITSRTTRTHRSGIYREDNSLVLETMNAPTFTPIFPRQSE